MNLFLKFCPWCCFNTYFVHNYNYSLLPACIPCTRLKGPQNLSEALNERPEIIYRHPTL